MSRILRQGAHIILLLIAIAFLFSGTCQAQDNPILKIDDDVSRFAYSNTGRIAYAARHVFSVKKVQLQRDDIWICEPDGKKRRILQGEKFIRGTGPFSYIVRGLRWSPDGGKLAVELGTSEMVNEDGETREGIMTLLLDDTGREITMPGTGSVIPGAINATWLTDGAAIVYLKDQSPAQAPATGPAKAASAPPAQKLFTINRMNPFANGESRLFQGHSFSVVAWSVKQDTGVAIERDSSMTGPVRLIGLDLAKETSRPIGTLEGYAGGLSISPSGKRVAYWIDNGQLEVREMDAPNRLARLHVPVGTLAWSGNEARILVKRGASNRSGGLVWLSLPPLANVAPGAAPVTAEVVPQSVLHDLEFRQFDVSPDGRALAVVEPGRRNLLAYPIS